MPHENRSSRLGGQNSSRSNAGIGQEGAASSEQQATLARALWARTPTRRAEASESNPKDTGHESGSGNSHMAGGRGWEKKNAEQHEPVAKGFEQPPQVMIPVELALRECCLTSGGKQAAIQILWVSFIKK